MNNVRLEWHGDEAKEHVNRRVMQFIKAMCIEVKNTAKRLLSVPGTGRVKGRKVKGGKVTHSPDGAPPYKQTGRLRASIASELEPATLTGRVGTNVFYGRILELTNHPWLRRSLAESSTRTNAILAKMGEDK